MTFLNNILNKFKSFNISEKIILVNVILFVIPFFLKSIFYLFDFPVSSLMGWFKLSPEIITFIYRPWTLITYSFIHGGINHVLWNMLLLYFSSKLFLNLFSSQKFINTYFLGIIFGGIIFILSYSFFPVFKESYPNLIGSSAGVMAVFIFVCTYSPNQEIRIIFFNLKLQYLGILIVLLDVIQIPSGNAGGNLAHLGGALFGFIYANQLQRGNDVGFYFEKIWVFLESNFEKSNNLKTVYKTKKNLNNKESNNQKKIDIILDKISKSGYDSLSNDEKDFLFKIGKN